MTIPLLINECSHFDEIKTRLTSPEVCAGQPQRLYSRVVSLLLGNTVVLAKGLMPIRNCKIFE